MLREWISHRTMPASTEAKALGYLKEHIAIQARHRRCHGAWKEHLERTRRFVLWAAANCPGQDKVTILGSGGLLDVPLDELANDFAEIVLVDMIQPPSVRHWARQYANVRLVEADITDMAESILAGDIPDPPPVPQFPDADADLVISLNLLGQLPLIPRQYLPKEWRRDRAGLFAEEVQRQHLRALQAVSGRVCLVTETHRDWLDDDGIDETESAIGDIKLPEPEETWVWDLAPAPEIERDRDLRLRVVAYSNLFRK